MCFLTMRVSVNGIDGDSPLVQVVVGAAELCVPLADRLIAVAGTIHTALVGIRHLDHPVTVRWTQY